MLLAHLSGDGCARRNHSCQLVGGALLHVEAARLEVYGDGISGDGCKRADLKWNESPNSARILQY